MSWFKDEWDQDFDDLLYGCMDEEDDGAYFDVPLPYRPIEIITVRNFRRVQ